MSLSVNLLITNDIANSGLPESYQQPKTDVRHFHVNQLGIDEVREITKISHQKSWSEGDLVIVLVVNNISVEAQNALLKLFEDPPKEVVFYLLLPSESILLPTLRSRFIRAERVDSLNDIKLAEDFMKMSYAQRLQLIADKNKSKDVAWMENLVTSLGQLDKTRETSTSFKRALLLSESFIRIRGASRKALLEELALSLNVS